MAYDSLSPIGDERGDIQAALVATHIVNANLSKRDQRPLSDFLPRFGEKPKQSVKDMKAALRAFKATLTP